MKNILINKKKNKVLAVVFPHPDDESFMSAGLLLEAKKCGWKTVVIILTKGEAGKMYINLNGKSVSQVRKAELEKVVKLLKADRLILGNFEDGKLKKQKSVWSVWLKNHMQKIKPGLVVTYDHSGFSGHPDHIVLSVMLLEIIKKLNFTPKLFWVSVPDKFINKHSEYEATELWQKSTHSLNLGKNSFSKILAIKAHKSQNLISIRNILKRIPYLRQECYYEVNLNKKYRHKYFNFEI